VLQVARAAGLVGRRRVLDSTPIYDAVATMDTVTLVRSVIRGLLRVADADVEKTLRAVLTRDDDYASAGKPVCDYEDRTARAALVDALARDAMALVAALDGRELDTEVDQAARLLATVAGQDLDRCEDGMFRIARRVATDRVVSTVDPDARHGHKTSAHGFDGYKGHLAADPDTEIITATTVSAANAGDAEPAEDLLAEDLPEPARDDGGDTDQDRPGDRGGGVAVLSEPDDVAAESVAGQQLAVYGDAAYGAGKLLATLENAGARIMTKVQPPRAPGGRFAKDRFAIDLAIGTVTCPGQVTVAIRPAQGGGGTAAFGAACAACRLAAQCTASATGRVITISAYERQLARARAAQSDPAWRADYTAIRPKVERKIAHLMRHRHGGRRARVRGTTKVAADFSLLAAAVNLARLGVFGLRRAAGAWEIAPA
jgi:Transposase DDE domain